MEALSLLEKADIDPATKQALMASFQSLLAETKHHKLKIQALSLELAHLKRLRFGKRSESLTGQQLDLFAECVDEDMGSIHAELATTETEAQEPKAGKPRQKAGRQPLPDHLPRIEFRHEPESCQCGACGEELVKIGEDISEQLDVTPAIFAVHRHIRPQYACRSCETITAAVIPPAIIDGGLATPGLLSWVVISKYADHRVLRTVEFKDGQDRCFTKDEGRPLDVGFQERASNRHKLRRLRASVASIAGKGRAGPCQVRTIETSANELLMTCRNVPDDAKTGREWLARDKDEGNLITAHLASGMKVA